MVKKKKEKIKIIYHGYARISIFTSDLEPGKMQVQFALSIEDDKLFAEEFMRKMKET